LVRQFGELSSRVEGAGVHWHCTVARDERECRIHCFALRDEAEYLTKYRQADETIAHSRSPSVLGTLSAVADWLNGAELTEMYECYPFIDEQKRILERISGDVFGGEPGLAQSSETELRHHADDLYTLFIRGSGRSCKMSYSGKIDSVGATFSWDDSVLFQFSPADNAQLALVLKSWLCDTLQPSEMRLKFPWLTIGELADYYEAGNPVEGEFIVSWAAAEEFYLNLQWSFSDAALRFMQELRAKGYDKTLRAGQSMSSLVLSRMRRSGVRGDRPSIQFWFHKDGMKVVNYIDNHRNGVESHHPRIELTSEIDALLRQLESKPVD
ncbi:MAG: hypothetical protein KDA66_18550, partial [Planctomycetaceae bacterium]|nr:hypothetical protein [Planctomycetaceae bacterium]